MRSLRSVTVIVFLGMFATAISGIAGAQLSRAPAVTHDLMRSIGLVKPAMTHAPDFNLRDSNGSPVSLSGYRGGWVLLNFWATWCAPCREEMPSMERLSRSFDGQGLSVVAINQRENDALVNGFMKTQGLNFSTPIDNDGRVAASYRVYGIPVSYVIDDSGRAIGMKSGSMDWGSAKVVEVFRRLIGDRGGGSASTGPMGLEPTTPMPKLLRAKSDGVSVRGQQQNYAEIIGKMGLGEELVPLGKVFGAGEFWYMVRTKKGAVGWVRGADVE